MGKRIRLSKTSAEGLARFWISYRHVLRFSQSLTGCCYFKKYYPNNVNYVACGRLIGCQKQLFRLKSHIAK